MRQPTQPDPYQPLEKAYRTAYLIAGFLQKTLTLAEEDELDEWISEQDSNQELFASITGGETQQQFLNWFDAKHTALKLKEARQQLGLDKPVNPYAWSLHWWKYAAAVIVLAAGVAWYLLAPVQQGKVVELAAAHIQPGHPHAILRTGTGDEITLQTGKDTLLLRQIAATNNVLQYPAGSPLQEWHTLIVPRNAFYQLVLPDGSRVWLNAASSLRYPTSFTSSVRAVELEGEAFFDIAKDSAKPFLVKTAALQIEALGTAFNVQAYPDEQHTTATLVEGSVRVTGSKPPITLRPGQQLIHADGSWNVHTAADVASITAWKDHQFKLSKTDIRTAMRMISRWYDVTVTYRDEINYHFNGTISRDVPLSEVLQLLEETGHVHFSVQQNNITVMK